MTLTTAGHGLRREKGVYRMPANMPRLRVLLLWLLMLALPMQGAAAASMVACGMPGTAASTATHDMPHHAGMQGHADSHRPMHAHDGAQQDEHQAHASHSQHGDHAKADGGGMHKCSVCSACHAAALLDMPVAGQPHALPQATPAMRLQAMASQAPRLPDKPPRA